MEKVRDIVEVYLNPPQKAVVLCVGEKSQIQAMDPTQPMLGMGLAHVEGVTHDHVRRGTTTVLAAMNIASGKVISAFKHQGRHHDHLDLLIRVEIIVPAQPDIRNVVDNATHEHPAVKRQLAAQLCYHVHHSPTYASWHNEVEIWFHLITQRGIRRRTFRGAKDLVSTISLLVQRYNAATRSFVWTATANSVLEKVESLCRSISEGRRWPPPLLR